MDGQGPNQERISSANLAKSIWLTVCGDIVTLCTLCDKMTKVQMNDHKEGLEVSTGRRGEQGSTFWQNALNIYVYIFHYGCRVCFVNITSHSYDDS